jgi:predicted permease
MLIVLEQVGVLLLFCAIGFLLAKMKILKSEQGGLLSGMLVYIFMPATVFSTCASNCTVAYITQKYPLILVSAGLLVAIILLSKLILHLTGKPSYQRDIYEYSLIIPNTGYIGYPLVLSLFGSEGLLDMLIFGMPLILYTYTVGYNLLTDRRREKFSLKKLLTPVTVAMALGCAVGLSGLKLPGVFTQVIDKSAACLAPMGTLLMGMSITEFGLKEMLEDKRIWLVTALRLVVIPLAVFGVIRLGRWEFAMMPAICSYAMPCGINSIIFPKLIGKECHSGAGLVLVSTILSIITVPLCVYFFI